MKLVFRLLLVVLFIFFGCGENKPNKSMNNEEVKEKKKRMEYSGYWIMYNTEAIKNFFNLPVRLRGNDVIFDTDIEEGKGSAIFLYETKKYDFSINKIKRNEFELIYKKNKLSVHLKKDDTADDILYLFFMTGNIEKKIENGSRDGICRFDIFKNLDETIKVLREENEIAEVEEDIVENCGFDPTTDPTIVKDEKENKEKK